MKASSQSLADQVYTLIKNEILRGELALGEIVREDKLALRYQVSRTPVREALKRLDAYGLVRIAPRSHTTIAKIDESESRDIAEVRIYLEQYAILHRSCDILEKKLPILSYYAEACNAALLKGERESCFELDSLFHLSLVEIAGNTTLSELYSHLDARIQLLRVKQGLNEATLSSFLSQHGELLQLLKKNRLSEAASLLRYHVLHEKD